MATTSYGVNDALAVKLWAKELTVEALKYTPIAPLIGTSPDSIIHLKTQTQKSSGDKITYGLVAQLTGDGVTENQILEGNEESLTTFSDSIFINELAHAVRVKSDRRIDKQRVPFDLRETAKSRLRDWYAKRISVSCFNQLGSNVAETRTIYTGNQATIAVSTGRQVLAGGVANVQSLGNTNLMTLKLIDYAKEIARTSTTPLRPVMVGGEEKYVLYLHPWQVVDLRTDASTAGNWFDITAKAIQGGEISKNPIYTGALGEYNGVVLREAIDVPVACRLDTGAQQASTRRAVFLGAQAAGIAFGMEDVGDAEKFTWVEELFDYERELGISAQTIFGLKKVQFNSTDFGVIAIDTYAAAHATAQ